jgi:hypothetical protein
VAFLLGYLTQRGDGSVPARGSINPQDAQPGVYDGAPFAAGYVLGGQFFEAGDFRGCFADQQIRVGPHLRKLANWKYPQALVRRLAHCFGQRWRMVAWGAVESCGMQARVFREEPFNVHCLSPENKTARHLKERRAAS